MKKKLLSTFLSLALCLSLLPTAALAEEPVVGEPAHSNHCICGANHVSVGDHTAAAIPESEWTAVTDTLPTTSGNYYLTADVTISSQWTIENGKNIVLCLNGKTLTADNAAVADTILIEGALTITDCKGTGKITGTNTATSGNHKAIVVSTVYADCTLNLYGGKITGIHSGGLDGAGVHNEGTFNMYGGTISGNTAPSGSGVDNYKNGANNSYCGPADFNFYGGTIKDNISTKTDGAEIQNRLNSKINASNSVTFSGTVSNKGTISGGSYSGAVSNKGTISGGTFTGTVTNEGTISGGTFTGTVTNEGTISGGTFTGTVTDEGTISGGTFNGEPWAETVENPTVADISWYTGHENDSSFTISNEKHLLGLAQLVNRDTDPVTFEGKTITLTKNITLATTEWTPIGNGSRSGSSYTGNAFKGTFNGGGKTIQGLKIHSGGADAALGLFGVVDGGTVKNLTLTGVAIDTSTNKNTGAAIGLMVGGATVDSITVKGAVEGADGVGGIVGRMTISGTIKNCVNNATVDSAGKAGGIVGAAYYTAEGKLMTIENCTNKGDVTSSAGYIGGIVGLSAAKVSGCKNTADVIGDGESIGGIVGEQQNYGSVTGCANSGNVLNYNNYYSDDGTAYGTGGIVGWLRYNGKNEDGKRDYTLKGMISVTNNTNSGVVVGGHDAGGIVGRLYNAAVVTGNENTAQGFAAAEFAAGIVGSFQTVETPIQGSGSSQAIPRAKLNCYNNVSTTESNSIITTNETGCTDLYVYDNTANTENPNTGEIRDNSTACVAKIGTVKYATLNAAVTAAETNDTIVLQQDISLNDSIDINKKVTIDLNSKNITFATQKKRFEVSGGTLNLTGSGMVKEQEPYLTPVHIRGSSDPNAAYNTVVKVGKDVTLQGWAGIMIDRNKVYDHNYAYGVEVIVDGKLIGVNDVSNPPDPGHGIYINGQVQATTGNVPKITLNSTSNVSGASYGIFAAGYGKWTLAGTVSGEGGIEAKAGVLNITGGSITANATSTTHAKDDGGVSTTGYAIAAVDNEGYAGNPTITISNCNVTGAVAVVDDDNDPTNDRATISITGGTFSTDPTAYVASGYKVTQNGDDTWTVSRKSTSSSSSGSSSSTAVTVPVSSESSSVDVKAEVSKTGTATIEISDKQVKQVAANGSGTVTVDVSKLEKVESVSVPAHVVEATDKAEDTGLTVALPDGSVALDETALESVTTGKDITVSVQQVPVTDLTKEQQKAVGDMANIGLVVDVDVYVGNTKQSSFNGGKLTISVPYTPKRGEDTSKLTVWFIKDDGTIENKGGYYDAEKKCFVFETEHLSRYVLVSVNEQFSDVAVEDYYAAAVNWAVAQNITNGIGDGKFGPDLGCTRGQIVTFLWRAAGCPVVNFAMNFSDVDETAFYGEAVRWAASLRIAEGYGDGFFGPDDTCTRAQIVTMLYRYAVTTGKDVSVGEDTNILSYTDFASVPEFAIAPFQWACGANIIQGADGKLMPNDTCTRGQIVTMLYRANG